ncbi:MAG: hypothetical protein JNG86_03630, partial [Verrucomicrobiaceae bacterium]|nr:hypothetical protein [Verrucomicrobiaceae bacterium]
GETRAAAHAGAARVWLDSDPEKALALLPEITNERLHARIHSAMAAYRAMESPEAGFAYADSLPDSKMREMARRSVLESWAERDPAAASRYLLSQPSPADVWFTQRAILEWARLEPEAAVAFTIQHDKPLLDTGIHVPSPLHYAMNHWAADDPVSAAGWLSQQPAGLARDRATGVFAGVVARQQPDVAIEWASSIRDRSQRNSALGVVLGEWGRQDPSRAVAWLETSGYDEDYIRLFKASLETSLSGDYLSRSSTNYVHGTIIRY